MITQIGTPRELYASPVDAFVADFIGEANLIPCETISIEGGTAETAVHDDVRRPLKREARSKWVSRKPDQS